MYISVNEHSANLHLDVYNGHHPTLAQPLFTGQLHRRSGGASIVTAHA